MVTETVFLFLSLYVYLIRCVEFAAGRVIVAH